MIGAGSLGDLHGRFVQLSDSKTSRMKFADGAPIRGAIRELDRASAERRGTVQLLDDRRFDASIYGLETRTSTTISQNVRISSFNWRPG